MGAGGNGWPQWSALPKAALSALALSTGAFALEEAAHKPAPGPAKASRAKTACEIPAACMCLWPYKSEPGLKACRGCLNAMGPNASDSDPATLPATHTSLPRQLTGQCQQAVPTCCRLRDSMV